MARTAATLAAAGVPAARAEAELLVGYVLAVPRGRLALAEGLDAAQRDRLSGLVARRVRREPLQHLLGSAPFRHLELAVGPGVFIPRPETELLAGWGIAAAGPDPATVVDLCSGSGALALSVAQELPGASVWAVERSPAALDWLRRNAADRAAAGDPAIRVVAGDVADPRLLGELSGRVDLVLCNPPYVPAGTAVPAEVDRYDPAEAVFGGGDGLAVIRPVITLAARLLRPGGSLGIEHDDTHAAVLPDLLRADGAFTEVADHPDLAGRPRFATARRR
ncbi:peptide chain release factor N(5)-glutamine methyltransferase [Plantactinospora sp. KBS50]|uniref:peptide chain release factor N(5)-glutamine methyltransferase n=1 Tax=Plantactinospora sp. KBS50 TaxID=2024580 RepID=UPI000BAAFB43|nr:peptide chain release factor N(5)-glutamine methyltransferase [Plantactinospora sp. KBS50]ASW56459.1 protein-(glutamine-N5) methyltransferase, release factor-specific [Plantactinospora sp. KBS50]